MNITTALPTIPPAPMPASDFVGRDNQQRSLIKESPEAKQNGTASDKQSAEKNAKQSEESTSKEPADKKPSERTAEEQQEVDKEIQELRRRDAEVRQHEQAHASVGGQYAGSPQYEYERGPEGKSYAVGGEVAIDVAVVPGDPQATINKMTVVRRAALAPAQPSSADRSIAAEASTKAAQARAELAQQNGPNGAEEGEKEASSSDNVESSKKRSLEAEEKDSNQAANDESPETDRKQLSAPERGAMVADFYQRRVSPAETGFSASA